MKPIIEIHDLTKVYGQGETAVRALDSVSLNIEEGEFVAIMGPSGSGKSTFMNILGCLDTPTSGSYQLNAQDVGTMNKAQLARIRNERIGFVFQSYNLLARTSALENVMLPVLYDRHNGKEEDHRQRALDLIDTVGLANRASHMPHELSGGQAQRVAIARALINNPVIILADEPTGNLDSKSGIEIMELLGDLHDEGRTIAMVTHDEHIAAFAERRIHFLDGHIENDKQHKKKKKGK